MRFFALVAGLALGLNLVGCGAATSIWVEHGDRRLASDDVGQAMVAYDKAVDDDPTNAALRAKRAAIADRWVREQAAKLGGDSDAERSFALLDQLAAEGRKRGADRAVNEAVAPALDAAANRIWHPIEEPANTRKWWLGIAGGEAVTARLTDGSKARQRLVETKRRAASWHRDQAKSAKHVGAAWLHFALAHRYDGGPIPTDTQARFDAAARPAFKMTIEAVGGCGPAIEKGLRKRYSEAPILEPLGQLPVDVAVRFECVAPTGNRVSYRTKSWLQAEVKTSRSRSCRTNRVQSHQVTTWARKLSGYGRVRTGFIQYYKDVQSCSTTTVSTRTEKRVTDTVKVQERDEGYIVQGLASFRHPGGVEAWPLSAQLVGTRYITTGALYGHRESAYVLPENATWLVGHTIWRELLYARTGSLDNIAADSVNRAEAAAAASDHDTEVGERIVATVMQEKVVDAQAAWLQTRLGWSAQDAREVLLGKPHVARSAPASRHKLAMPALDREVVKRAVAEQAESGDTGY